MSLGTISPSAELLPASPSPVAVAQNETASALPSQQLQPSPSESRPFWMYDAFLLASLASNLLHKGRRHKRPITFINDGLRRMA